MTVWKKLENEECYAVAICNFQGREGRPHLTLDVGELVHIERETDQWYWGSSLRRDDAIGAFPKSHVVIRECNVDRCGESILASAGARGVVCDIAITLREWLLQWKKLYITNDDRFKFMEVSMRALLQLRAQAASGALPQDELRRVARTALYTLDKGNRILGMELAVRTTSGQLVNPMETSMYTLNAMHEEANARIGKNMETTPSPPTQTQPVRSYSLIVRVHNFVCRIAEAAELLLSLHDAHQNKLTEHVLLVKRPQSLLNHTQVVFTDLSSDIKKEKVFLVCQVVRIGSMEQQNVDHRRSTLTPVEPSSAPAMRRPFGVAAADVTRHLALTSDNSDKHILMPFYACEKEKMDTLLKQVMSNQRDLKDVKHPQGMWVSLQLVEGDLKQISEENPHLVLGSTVVARKMGFPEVILPGDARNDLYVTLCHGSFAKGGVKSSERNIELTARVVYKDGHTLKEVISIGAGVPLGSEYTSLVYYHDDKPRWQEVFKVCLNIETFKDAHIVFLLRHRSSNEAKDRAEKFFGLSYLQLMQREGTTTPDGQHELCVYKIDPKRAQTPNWEAEAAEAVLGLPSRRRDLPTGHERGLAKGLLTLLTKDTLTVATKLCSTKLTQREEILGVLKWSKDTLRESLKRLDAVPSEEIVKFIQDILDALFAILTQVQEEEEGFNDQSYGVLVLECLLHVISLVADRKYHHFQPVLEVYIDESFCDAMAYEKLIAVIVWVIRTADGNETKRLLQCMKCLEWLVRVIARSRQLRDALGETRVHFNFQFESLLSALVWLMRCGESALTCQGAALKFLPPAANHALRVYPATDLCTYIVSALEALPLPRLSKQRVLALLELVRGPLCRAPAARAKLVPHLAETIRTMLINKMEWDREAANKSRSVGKTSWFLGADTGRMNDQTNQQQILELCIDTLGEVLTLLARRDVGPVDADRAELARRLLPTGLRAATGMLHARAAQQTVKDDPVLRRLVSVLTEMVRQMSPELYTSINRAIRIDVGVSGEDELIKDALSLILSLIQRPVYKSDWADMLHLQHHVMLHGLRLLSTTLKERLHTTEDDAELSTIHSLCGEWFLAAGSLATSPPLQLENLPAARRRHLLALYGDIRRSIAELLSDMWFSMEEHKRSFIPGLVGTFLEVSFLKDEEVRNTTIPLFFDMMQTEMSSGVGEGDATLKDLESELIDKIDVLAERGCGDVAWRERFVSLCGALCSAATSPARDAGLALVAAAARQLDTLLQYRTAALRSATPYKMHLITKVLDFYAQIERPHMYIRYVHKLAQMHRDASQWAEAGLTLRLHAKLLAWSAEPLPPRLRHPDADITYDTQRQLKEHLYRDMARWLDEGLQLEMAVEVNKELVRVYEEEMLGYDALSALHAELSKLYRRMLTEPRRPPAYFRVTYYGKGFPDHLREPNGFIYRGNEYEQIIGFRDRLLELWPDATTLSTLDTPPEHITEGEGQYLQINAVTPVMNEKMKRFSGKPVADQILEYYKHNNVDRFVFNRPFSKPEESLDPLIDKQVQEFATRWLERTELQIADTLPGILRWAAVVRSSMHWVSPLQAGVEALREAARELRATARAARDDARALKPLTMRLTGTLDAGVQGGISNYELVFLTPAYAAAHPDHAPLIAEMKELIADLIPLLEYGLEIQKSRTTPDCLGLHERLERCFRELKNHVYQRYGRKTYDFESEQSEVQLRGTMRDSTVSGAARLSDNSQQETATKTRSLFSLNGAYNPLARNSNSSGIMKFGTINPPKKRNKNRSRKSDIGTQASGSQWYTSPTTHNGSTNNNMSNNNSVNNSVNNSFVSLWPPDTPTSPLIELREHLITERPLRHEAEFERRLSQRHSLVPSAPHSNRDSIGTTDSNQEEEEPPPLPLKSYKSQEADSENNNQDYPPRYNYDTVCPPRGSFLYSSLAKNNAASPPAPPPKKRHQQNIEYSGQ